MIDVIVGKVALGLGRFGRRFWADGVDVVCSLQQVALFVEVFICFTGDLFGGQFFYLFAKQLSDPGG